MRCEWRFEAGTMEWRLTAFTPVGEPGVIYRVADEVWVKGGSVLQADIESRLPEWFRPAPIRVPDVGGGWHWEQPLWPVIQP